MPRASVDPPIASALEALEVQVGRLEAALRTRSALVIQFDAISKSSPSQPAIVVQQVAIEINQVDSNIKSMLAAIDDALAVLAPIITSINRKETPHEKEN